MRAVCAAWTTMVVIGVWITAGPATRLPGASFGEVVDVGRREPALGLDEHVAPAAMGGAGILAGERLDRNLGAGHAAARGEPEHGHLDAGPAIGRALAVFALIQRLEVAHQRLQPGLVERGRGAHRVVTSCTWRR